MWKDEATRPAKAREQAICLYEDVHCSQRALEDQEPPPGSTSSHISIWGPVPSTEEPEVGGTVQSESDTGLCQQFAGSC